MSNRTDLLRDGFWGSTVNAKKAHYFIGSRSICGKWMSFNPYKESNQTVGEKPGKTDCVQCWRKVAAARRACEEKG